MANDHNHGPDRTHRSELREYADATRRTVLHGLGAGATLSTIGVAKGHQTSTGQTTEDSQTQQQDDGHLTCDDWGIGGELTEDDDTGVRSDEHFHDTYTFDADEGAGITLYLEAWDGGFPYLYVVDPDGNVVAEKVGCQPGLGDYYSTSLRHRFEQTGQYEIVLVVVPTARPDVRPVDDVSGIERAVGVQEDGDDPDPGDRRRTVGRAGAPRHLSTGARRWERYHRLC